MDFLSPSKKMLEEYFKSNPVNEYVTAFLHILGNSSFTAILPFDTAKFPQ
jgi:hypothetical protein